MTDQLTTLRRKYGYCIPYCNFVTKPITNDAIENDAFIKHKFIVELMWHSRQEIIKYIVLASSKKKIRNIFKTKLCNEAYTLVKVTKYNEQTKLTTKAKINTIKSIINRVKADWEHIRS